MHAQQAAAREAARPAGGEGRQAGRAATLRRRRGHLHRRPRLHPPVRLPSVKKLDDPLRDDPVAAIDNSCVGCGNCGEVADAAILCPSFYRTDIISNPSRRDRWLARLRGAFAARLQRRREARRLSFA
jgi:hypothetical protein